MRAEACEVGRAAPPGGSSRRLGTLILRSAFSRTGEGPALSDSRRASRKAETGKIGLRRRSLWASLMSWHVSPPTGRDRRTGEFIVKNFAIGAVLAAVTLSGIPALADQPLIGIVSITATEANNARYITGAQAAAKEIGWQIATGFTQDEHSSGFSRKFGIPTWISPIRMLAEMGIRPEAISDIFVTHAHFDHLGSIAEFPDAHIYIQKSELLSWYEAIALPKRFGHLTAIIDPDNLRAALGGDLERLVVLHDIERWKGLPIVKEVEGFRIVKIA